MITPQHSPNPGSERGRAIVTVFAGRVWLILIALFLNGARLFGAATYFGPDYLVDYWETEQGLPENSATAMVQTPDGYLWFGTFNGLVRFDGVNFSVFEPEKIPEIANEGIVNLHLDHDGRLWVSTYGGLVVKDGPKWLRMGGAQGWTGNYVRTFSEQAGVLCLTSFDGKVFQVRGLDLRELPEPPGKRGQGYFGFVDRGGVIWVGQDHFFGRFAGTNWVASPLAAQLTNSFAGLARGRAGEMLVLRGTELLRVDGDRVLSRKDAERRFLNAWHIHEDSRGIVWVSTDSSGLFGIFPESPMRHFGVTNGLSYNGIRFTFEDRESNLWIGTGGGGLMRMKERMFRNVSLDFLQPSRKVNALAEAASGEVYLGLFGEGVVQVQNGVARRLLLPNGSNVARHVHCLLTDTNLGLWIGTLGKGLRIYQNESLREISSADSGGTDIDSLYRDSFDRIWIGGNNTISIFQNGQFHPVTNAPGLNLGGVTSFAEEPGRGRIWASTLQGVFRMESNRWEEVRDGANQPFLQTTCLHFETNGTLWLGGQRRGLVRWKAGRFSTVDESVGLPVRRVASILDDGLGYFWIGSNRGVVRARLSELHQAADGEPRALQCQLFNVSDGMVSQECSAEYQSTAMKDRAGHLWFGTLKGAVFANPHRVILNTNPPMVVVERITYRDQQGQFHELPWQGAGEVVAPPGSREIGIHFGVMSFTAPEKVRILYQLEGRDTEWRDTLGERTVTFHTPEPRRFRFLLKTSNNDGFWNEKAVVMPLIVQPFFWQTLWFRLGLWVSLAAGTALTAWRLTRRRLRDQLQRLEQERVLERAKARLSAVMEATSDLVGFATPAGEVFYVNPAGLRMAGLKEVGSGEAVRLSDLFPAVAAEVLQVARRDGIWSGESVLHRRDGGRLPISQVVVVHRRPDGGVDFFSTIGRDISALKLAEAESRRNEASIRALIDALPDPAGLIGADGVIISANKAMGQHLGRSAAELVGVGAFTVLPPEAAGRRRWHFDEVIQSGVQAHFEDQVEDRHYLNYLSPVTAPSGRVWAVAMFSLDITDRKQAEEALRQSEAQLQLQFKSMPIGCIFWNPDFTVVSWNPAAESIFGYSEAEMLGRLPYGLIVPTQAQPQVAEIWRRLQLEPIELQSINENLTRDGRVITCSWLNTPMRDGAGRLTGILSMVQDITERRLSEEALRSSEERLRACIDNTPNVAVQWYDESGRVLFWNRASEKVFGWKSSEAITKTLDRLIHTEEETAAFLETLQEVKRTGRSVGPAEYPFRHRDGSVGVCMSTLFPIPAPEGGFWFVCMDVDVTERKKAEEALRRSEEALRHSQKMEAVGQLAGGVAHDFNNLITVILGNASLLEAASLNPGERAHLSDIARAAERAANLTRQLLAFSRRQVLQPKVLDANQLVSNLVRLLQRLIGEDIALQTQLALPSALVHVDAGMIEQAIINLAVNARDAMPNGGALVIRVDAVQLTEEAVQRHPAARPGAFVQIAVTDTGSGISPDHLPHIFEPFFTTKEVGKGTGLGLATVFGVAQQHEGWVEVKSQVGQGTTMSLFLPRRDEAKSASATVEVAALPKGSETILLVEDDAALRLVSKTILTRCGYTILEAGSGQSALQVWNRESASIDLVLTDLVMPEGMTGRELGARLQREKASLKIIFTSGYSQEISGKNLELPPGSAFLQKPFDVQALARIVRQTLDEA